MTRTKSNCILLNYPQLSDALRLHSVWQVAHRAPVQITLCGGESGSSCCTLSLSTLIKFFVQTAGWLCLSCRSIPPLFIALLDDVASVRFLRLVVVHSFSLPYFTHILSFLKFPMFMQLFVIHCMFFYLYIELTEFIFYIVYYIFYIISYIFS